MPETVEVEFDRRITETDDAVLFEIDAGEQVWIPKSEILDEEDGWLTIPRRLAEEKELV